MGGASAAAGAIDGIFTRVLAGNTLSRLGIKEAVIGSGDNLAVWTADLEGSLDDVAGALCSFSAETEVVMGDGTTKPISKIEIGDQVLAEDPETGERGARTVTQLWIHDDTLVDLAVDGQTVTTTENHPFWNQTDGEWQRADDLDRGDVLLGVDGQLLPVVGIEKSSGAAGAAYNLTVDDLHTYFVSTSHGSVLVHNTCSLPALGHRNVLEGPLPTGNLPAESWTREELEQLEHDLMTSVVNRQAEIGTDFTFDPTDYIHPKRIQDELSLLRAVQKALSGS
jgi:hypothetical protein